MATYHWARADGPDFEQRVLFEEGKDPTGYLDGMPGAVATIITSRLLLGPGQPPVQYQVAVWIAGPVERQQVFSLEEAIAIVETAAMEAGHTISNRA